MTPAPPCLVLSLIVAPAPSSLSPEAAERNAKAMQLYDAGQLGAAVDEFFAAYRSMPNARRDRAGREQLLGSLRSTLLSLHAETGAAAPLCRLQALLQEHAEALASAWPEAPELPELRSARARHREVTQKLAAAGAGACPVAAAVPVVVPAAPAPVVAPVMVVSPAMAPSPAPASVAVTPSPGSGDALARRRLVAGGVVLPLGLAVLGALGGVAFEFGRDLAAADALNQALTLRRCTDDDRARMAAILGALQRGRGVMIGLGVAGGALVTAGTALLVRGGLQRRRARLGLDLRAGRAGVVLTGEF